MHAFKRWFSRQSLHKKVLFFLVLSWLSICLSFVAAQTLLYYRTVYQNILPEELLLAEFHFKHLAQVYANSWAMLAEELNYIDALPSVDAITLYKNDHSVISAGNTTVALQAQDQWPYRYRTLTIQATADITLSLAFRGTAFLEQHGALQLLLTSLLAIALTLPFVLLCNYFIYRFITQPIRRLTHSVQHITQTEDFQNRAVRGYNDETGCLVDAFNQMLTLINYRDQQIQQEMRRVEAAQADASQLATEVFLAKEKLEYEIQYKTRVEKRLLQTQESLNSIINSMPSVIIALNPDLYITQWNNEASVLSGTDADDALTLHITDAFPWLAQYHTPLMQALQEKQIQVIEKQPFEADSPRLLTLVIYPLMHPGLSGAVIRIDDITDKTRMQETLVQTEKMMSLGGLAAGMAHEINNPLSAILQNTQTLSRRLDTQFPANLDAAQQVQLDMQAFAQYLQKRDIARFLDNIHKAGARAANIVTNMLQFSRRSDNEFVSTHLQGLLDRVLDIACNQFDLKRGIDFKTLEVIREYSTVPIYLQCSCTEIEQVILNLLKNSAQAIHTRQLTQDESQPPGRVVMRCHSDTQQCTIQIEDNGIGMGEKTRQHIFEPFFTTKEVGVGTGLGLSVSYFIITSHHQGRMTARSTPGRGSCFTVQLPLNLGKGMA